MSRPRMLLLDEPSLGLGPIYVDRIFKGAKPADLPVDRTVKFELIINLKTAKTLGLDVPMRLLMQLDHGLE